MNLAMSVERSRVSWVMASKSSAPYSTVRSPFSCLPNSRRPLVWASASYGGSVITASTLGSIGKDLQAVPQIQRGVADDLDATHKAPSKRRPTRITGYRVRAGRRMRRVVPQELGNGQLQRSPAQCSAQRVK